MAARGDHLVIAAASLEHGRRRFARRPGHRARRVVSASRVTPRGLLEWQITLRDDGQRLAAATVPTLIQWGATHPAAAKPESGVTLEALCACSPTPDTLRRAYEVLGLEGLAVKAGAANLCAVLETPRGRVRLPSQGL
jgi:hypothetical protein